MKNFILTLLFALVSIVTFGVNPANIYTNPYFLYFDLKMPYNNDIITFKDGLILLQYMKNEEFREFKKQTKFGKLIAGTDFEDYAINNECIMDNKSFIEKKTRNF